MTMARRGAVFSAVILSLFGSQVVAPTWAQEAKEGTLEGAAIESYKREIVSIIQDKAQKSLKPQMRGVAIVEFEVSKFGIIVSSALIKSSRNQEVDKAALAAVEVGTVVSGIPSQAGVKKLIIDVPIKFVSRDPVDPSAQSSEDDRSNCAAITNSQIPYEVVVRADNRSFTKEDKTIVRLDPIIERLEVNRLSDGYVETVSRRSDGTGGLTSHNLQNTPLYSIDGDGKRTEFEYETPQSGDAVAQKRNYTQVYTRLTPGIPPFRRRLEAKFEQEAVFEISSCKFTTYRYRVELFLGQSPDEKPISTTIVDYAPELRIPVRQESSGPSVTVTRTAISISAIPQKTEQR